MKKSKLSLFDACDELAKMEVALNIPYEKQLTQWFGDYAMYEPKSGVSEQQIHERLKELKKEG